MSLKDTIKGVDDHDRQLVDCPEWGDGVQVLVKSFSAEDRMALVRRTKQFIDDESSDEAAKNQEYLNAVLLLACFDPETDEALFTDEDLPWLVKKNPAVLDRLVEAGLEVSGLAKDAVDAGKGVSS